MHFPIFCHAFFHFLSRIFTIFCYAFTQFLSRIFLLFVKRFPIFCQAFSHFCHAFSHFLSSIFPLLTCISPFLSGNINLPEKNKIKIRKSCEWRNKKAKKYLNHRQYEELYKNNYWFKWKAVKIETSD